MANPTKNKIKLTKSLFRKTMLFVIASDVVALLFGWQASKITSEEYEARGCQGTWHVTAALVFSLVAIVPVLSMLVLAIIDRRYKFSVGLFFLLVVVTIIGMSATLSASLNNIFCGWEF